MDARGATRDRHHVITHVGLSYYGSPTTII